MKTLGQIAKYLEGELRGDATIAIARVVHPALVRGPEDLALVLSGSVLDLLKQNQVANAVVPAELGPVDVPNSVLVPRPRLALARLLELFERPAYSIEGIHPTAVIDPSAKIGANTSIGPHCWIGPNSVVGANTRLISNVSVGADVQIGRRCLIHAGVFVGDRCEIGNHVIIQPNATIGWHHARSRPNDRATPLLQRPSWRRYRPLRNQRPLRLAPQRPKIRRACGR